MKHAGVPMNPSHSRAAIRLLPHPRSPFPRAHSPIPRPRCPFPLPQGGRGQVRVGSLANVFPLASLLLLLSACSLSLSKRYTGPAPVFSITGTGTACSASASSFTLQTTSPAALLDGAKVAAVPVILTNGLRDISTTATYQSEGAFTVAVPAGLEPGAWDVRVTPSGFAVSDLKRALDIVEPPVIDSITGGAACSAATVKDYFIIRGQRLSEASVVTLDGLATQGLTKTVEVDGSLRVEIPTSSLDKGRVYPIVVTNAAGCTAREADGVVSVDPPAPASFIVGPTLRDGATVPPGAPFTVRITGTAIVSGSVVTSGSVPALAVRATDVASQIEADFASLPAGPHTLAVANGSCSAAVPGSFNVSSPLSVTLAALNPSAVTGAPNHYLDITTAFAPSIAANVKPRFFVDVDPSPLATSWQQIAVEGELNGDRTLWRAYSPAINLATSARLDLRVEGAVNDGDPALAEVEGFLAGGLLVLSSNELPPTELSENAATRLVWKDRDHSMVGEHVIVYGCFGPDVQAELVAMNGTLGALTEPTVATLLIRGNIAAEEWAASKFRCLREQSNRVTRMLDLEIPAAVAPGAYRIRLRSIAALTDDSTLADDQREIVADDLYPYVVYGASPNLGTFSFAQKSGGGALTLSVGRKLAASAVVPDASGRKWLYVIGGDVSNVVSSSPLLVGTAGTTYDYSAVSSAHTLLGFSSGALAAAVTNPGDIAATYGMLALADGPSLYLVGGTTDGQVANTTGEIRSARANDPLLEPLATPGALLAFQKVGQLQNGMTEVKSYGHSGAILRTGSLESFTRKVVVLRGVEDASGAFVGTNLVLTANVDATTGVSNAGVEAAQESVAHGQAFAAFATRGLDRFIAFLGFHAPLNGTVDPALPIGAANNLFHSKQSIELVGSDLSVTRTSLSGVLDTAIENSITVNLPESCLVALAAGERAFFFGGVDVNLALDANDGAIDLVDEYDPQAPTDSIRTVPLAASAVALVSPTASLVTRRGCATSSFIAPNEFIVGGVVCKTDESAPGTRDSCALANKRGVSSLVESTTLQ